MRLNSHLLPIIQQGLLWGGLTKKQWCLLGSCLQWTQRQAYNTDKNTTKFIPGATLESHSLASTSKSSGQKMHCHHDFDSNLTKTCYIPDEQKTCFNYIAENHGPKLNPQNYCCLQPTFCQNWPKNRLKLTANWCHHTAMWLLLFC